jgi:hypothetical protein
MSYEFHCGDCLKLMAAMPADSVDLCFFSPPYEDARTYGIDFDLAGQDWVDWMQLVFAACQRVCKGLVACVCQGRTRNYKWSAVPALLIADLHRAGFNLRNPPIFHRVGIPGSGGPDWLRGDYEWIVCTARPGKLPWSDNSVMGHPPKWAPGGAMSHRVSDGSRINQWGSTGGGVSTRNADGSMTGKKTRPSHRKILGRGKNADGTPKRRAPAGITNGDTVHEDGYEPPVLANPGNLISCIVGGGVMGGDEFCSQNEAPFPEKLAEFFIRSFAPEGGRVLDPFSGSGTTVAVAHRWQRHGIGLDIRQSQIELGTKRLEQETPMMWS